MQPEAGGKRGQDRTIFLSVAATPLEIEYGHDQTFKASLMGRNRTFLPKREAPH